MTKTQNSFIKKLLIFDRRNRRISLFAALVKYLLILVVIWLSLVTADQLFNFSSFTRYGLLLFNSILIVLIGLLLLLTPLKLWLKKVNPETAAKELRNYYPQAEDNFLVASQLINQKENAHSSDNLRLAAIDKLIVPFQDENFSEKINLKSKLPPVSFLVTVAITTIILILFNGSDILRSSFRLLNPANDYAPVPAFRFLVEPGNKKIIKGQSLKVNVFYQGPKLFNCSLIQITDDDQQVFALNKSDSSYSLVLKEVRNTFKYKISGTPENEKYSNKINSSEFQIQVLQAPQITNLDIRIVPPSYTALDEKQLERNIGDISALKGSRILMNAQTNKALAQAVLKFEVHQEIPLQIRDANISGTFTVLKDDKYSFYLQDTSRIENQNPIQYHIHTLPDAAPFVTIPVPGSDIESQIDGQMENEIVAEDDFKINRLLLHYKISGASGTNADTSWSQIPIQFKKQRSVKAKYIWDFNQLPLAFGDTLQYFAQVFDNNAVDGPSHSKSIVYRVRFPSLDEIFDTVDQIQEEEISSLEDIKDQSEELKKQLDDIEREMRRAKQMDWEKKQSIQEIVQQQEQMQQKLEKLKKDLEQAVQKLEENNLISPQVLEKYKQLQEMFREVLSPEMKQALQKLQDANEKANPNEVRKALEEFKLNQQVFEDKIERTMELLKRVQFEQQLDRLVQKSKKIEQLQQKLSKELEQQQKENKPNIEQNNKLSEQQEQQLSDLKRDLDEFMREEMLEQFPETKAALDSAASELNSDQMKNEMQELNNQLSQNDLQQASQMSRQMQSQFNRINQQMQRAQSNMQQQNKQQLAEKMQRLSNQMLDLSFRQEQILNKTKKTSPLGNNFNDILKEQGQNLNNFNKTIDDLVSLSKETFFIPPQISKSLLDAQKGMQQSLGELSERNKGTALGKQSAAMRALNESALQMAQAQSQMMQSSSGTGFEQFMQQMQQMAGQQGQLNSESLQLLQGQGNKGMFSAQQQSQMQRLGKGQSALREAMEQIGEKMGQRDDVLGGLQNIASEMEKVEKDLLRGHLDRKTVDRQQKILSRMLDAQHSLEQREYSKKRKAEQAKKYAAKDPQYLKNGIIASKKEIEEAMRRAQKQGYRQDYLNFIQKYYEQLLRSDDQSSQN